MATRPNTFRRPMGMRNNIQKKPNAGKMHNTKMQLSFSSEGSSSDDLPTITTVSTVTSTPNLITDSESYSYSYESSGNHSNEVDWTSKNRSTRETIQRKPQPPQQPTNQTEAPPETQHKRVFRRNYQKNSQPEKPALQQQPQAKTEVRKKREESDSYDSDSNSSNEDKDTQVQKNIHEQISKRMSQPEENPVDTNNQTRHSTRQHHQSSTGAPQKYEKAKPIPPETPIVIHPIDADYLKNEKPPAPNGILPEETFQVIYEPKKSIALWKRHIQMTKNDILVFRSESTKLQPYGKVHIISTSKGPIEIDSKSYYGMIVRHQSGYRFTLYSTSQHAMPPPQIAGICFVDLKNENANIRMFRIAIADEPYTPSGKENDLSRIAYRGNEIPGVKVYSSELPMKQSNGTLTLDLGPYSIIRSIKNFIIRSPEGVPLFTIFKTFDGICTIKIRPPFTPIIAFALAVAISTSSK